MTAILDRFSDVARTFRPASVPQVVAIRLAAKLNDHQHIRLYVRYCEERPISTVIAAYQLASKRGAEGVAERFAQLLK